MTHSLKLCRSLRRMSPMYSQPRERRTVKKSRPNQIHSHWLVFILSLGHFLQWQLYRQWMPRAQTEQQLGDSAMVRAWGKKSQPSSQCI